MNPSICVARDEEGKIVTVRYQAVNAVLLNKVPKEQRESRNRKRQS